MTFLYLKTNEANPFIKEELEEHGFPINSCKTENNVFTKPKENLGSSEANARLQLQNTKRQENNSNQNK